VGEKGTPSEEVNHGGIGGGGGGGGGGPEGVDARMGEERKSKSGTIKKNRVDPKRKWICNRKRIRREK